LCAPTRRQIERAFPTPRGRSRRAPDLPQATVASDGEVLQFIDRQALFERGIGFVDAHLLAAARLMPGARL
jgi:hypothetical protein